MSSEQPQDHRRRPFSVNDLNRRTREVKIFNTTTITTTTTTHTHDSSSSRVTNTKYTNNENTDNNFMETNTTASTGGNLNADAKITSSSTTTKPDLRSKSAFSTNSEHYQYNSLPLTISTNSSVTMPSKRKIQFIYGKEQEQVDPNVIHNQSSTEYYPHMTNETNINDQHKCYKGVCNSNESYHAFPNVKTSFTTEISDGCFFNNHMNNCHVNTMNSNKRYVMRKEESDDTYDNYNVRAEKPEFIKKNMRVKDVEVECEIEEDPAIFEGSEGYVKNLISKIQQQYKNPETVHIKITRRQKPENIDKSGNLIKTSNESYGQIVRKEYYTIRTTNKPKKTNSMSSFVDTANIPYIDDSDHADSRNNSVRNSRIDIDTKHIYMPNYTIEKHIIYSEGELDGKRKKDKLQKSNLKVHGNIK